MKLDMDFVVRKLQKALGEPTYYNEVGYIADILNEIELDPKLEETAVTLGISLEEYTLRQVIGKLTGKTRYLKKKDAMDAYTTGSLDQLEEDMGYVEYIGQTSNVNEFVSLGDEMQKHDVRLHTEKMAILGKIKEEVDAGKYVEKIVVQGQTANKWLFDLGRGKDGDMYGKAIATIRELAKQNTYKGSLTEIIQQTVGEDLKTKMSSEVLMDKYPLLKKYKPGSVRKIISRLRLRLA